MDAFGESNIASIHAVGDVTNRIALTPVAIREGVALAQYGEIDIYSSKFRSMHHTLSGRDERTLVKLIVDRASQRVLGAHMVGADAPEIIQGLAIAIRMGATKADFDATVALHPSAAEEFVTLREKITRQRYE